MCRTADGAGVLAVPAKTLAAGFAHKLHQLRIWRNAATHHDAGRWAREGPASEAEAAQLIAECDGAIE